MQIEFTITGLKPTKRERRKPTSDGLRVAPVVETIVLAYQIEQAVRDGRARNFSEVAQQTGLTRARISQILRLLRLPKEVIESLLLDDSTRYQRLTERQLRSFNGRSTDLERFIDGMKSPATPSTTAR